MQIAKLLLLLIHFFDKRIKGKTLLQKRMYFLSVILNKDFGYHAYYYGPYSEKVDYAVDHNKSLGFISESVSDFMYQKRYEYEITQDGNALIQHLNKKNPDYVKVVKNAVDKLIMSGDDDDYMKISIAAKVHFIISNHGTSRNISKIKNSAKELGWKLNDEEIKSSFSFIDPLIS